MPDVPSVFYCLSIYWLELFHFNDQGNGIWDSDRASPDLRSELPSQLAFGLIASNTEKSWFPQNFAEDRPAGNWQGTIKLYLFVCLLLVFFLFFLSEPHRHFLYTCDIQAKIEWSPSIRTMSLIIENRLSLIWLYLKIFLAHFYSSEPSMDGNLDNNWIFQKNNLSSGNLCPQ